MSKTKACPICGGEAVVLGSLGYITHYRCQDCGIQFNHTDKRKQTARYRRAERKAKEQAQRFGTE